MIGSGRQAAISHMLCNVTERFDSSRAGGSCASTRKRNQALRSTG
jgi:hypothetical protein